MNSETEVLFFLSVIVIVCLGTFYDYVVRPVRRDEVRFRLFALRDRLRWKAVMQEVDTASEHYCQLEKLLCLYIDFCHVFTWQRFLISAFSHRREAGPIEFVQFEKNAPKALVELHNQAVLALLPALRANSPVLHKLMTLLDGFMRQKARVVGFFCGLSAADEKPDSIARPRSLVRV
jgi:hypothetical protein